MIGKQAMAQVPRALACFFVQWGAREDLRRRTAGMHESCMFRYFYPSIFTGSLCPGSSGIGHFYLFGLQRAQDAQNIYLFAAFGAVFTQSEPLGRGRQGSGIGHFYLFGLQRELDAQNIYLFAGFRTCFAQPGPRSIRLTSAYPDLKQWRTSFMFQELRT